ncbi:uncharacterized protein LOC133900677 isoform X2 [Phragmites australis]|uniref:uncharacterized protein LOC133900677 isoform X2 n=1 Tax=Phragmites australis TaxID=29695 RepID=UPI002D766F50|nr:uncharacterized protein LOC133900677 isoform X2 [Phragmites australis]
MERLPAMHLAVVALALCCCLIHASSAGDTSFTPGLRVMQDARAAPASAGADDQVVVAGEAEAVDVVSERMELELQDYPGSGANDRHSPWGQERRN